MRPLPSGICAVRTLLCVTGAAFLTLVWAGGVPLSPKTMVVGSDPAPPALIIRSPANGATLSGVVHVRGIASGPDIVGGVRFYVDKVLRGTDPNAEFDFTWSTAGVPAGAHALTVEATNAMGRTLRAAIAVSIVPETLYNSIVLPLEWPPRKSPTWEAIPAPYLANPPPVIRIDVGRQLFVDDFLIEQADGLTRTRHRPDFWPGNPILAPGGRDSRDYALVYSDGVWFDPADNTFKMWYLGNNRTGISYATSANGVDWTKPSIPDAEVPNTNVVLGQNTRNDSSTVWLDLEESDPAKRFKAFYWRNLGGSVMQTHFSPDGIHWGPAQPPIRVMSDRTTMFWNPFRKLWVKSMRRRVTLPASGSRDQFFARSRFYAESPDLSVWDPVDPVSFNEDYFNIAFWHSADLNDPVYPGSGGAYPELYNMDAVAYESLIVGLFSFFHDEEQPNGLTGPNIVEVNVGFSRDGYHWERVHGAGLDEAFISATNDPEAWDGFNTQSAGGCFLVVGDELWFYFSGRELGKPDIGPSSTGLARMRRDGFASMDAGPAEGVLTTRKLEFSGRRMFVNVDDPGGELRVEILDQNGVVLEPFSKANSIPITVDKTLHEVTWSGGGDLSTLAGVPVKFKFYLTNGRLYAFWVTLGANGASHGYVAAGGPGFTGPTDTVGAEAALPAVVEDVRLFPPGGEYPGAVEVQMATPTSGAAIHYTLDGATPTTRCIRDLSRLLRV